MTFLTVRSTPVYRRPTDVILLTLSAVMLLVVALAFFSAQGYLRVGDALLTVFRLAPDVLTEFVRRALEAGAFGVVLISVLIAASSRRWLLVRNLALASLVTLLLTGLTQWLIGRSADAALARAIPSSDVAMITAIAMVVNAFVSRRWDHLNWALVGVIILLEYLLAASSPLQILGGFGFGLLLGALTNVLLGVPQRDISTGAIREAFDAHHIALTRIWRACGDARGSVPYFATGEGGEYFVKLVGAEQRNADFLFKLYRTALLRDPASTAPFLTAVQQIEHEAYLTLLAQKQGVRTPDVEFTARVVGDYALLAQKRVPGRELRDLEDKYLTDHLLSDIWGQVALLHTARIYHGDLRLANILIAQNNQPWIIDFGFSAAGANDAVLAHDTAQLLASMSYVVGAERAVVLARNALGPEALIAARPNLNPLVLSSATRAELRDEPDLLEEIREMIEQETDASQKEGQGSPFRVRRP